LSRLDEECARGKNHTLEGLMKIQKEAKVPNFLKEVNLFERLDKQVINKLFKLGFVQNFKKEDLVIREGHPGGKLHILINGKAEVIKAVRGGKSRGKRLASYGRGSVFGEMRVFDGAPYSASVRALDNCDIFIVRGSDFEKFLKENPDTGFEIIRSLIRTISNRLRRTNLALSLASKSR
jgi:CRP-like cAMP-binding protein